MTPAKRRNFERLLTPKHIAFIGGTDAAVAIGEARRAGFAGEMWVVNPNRESLAGIPCVPSVEDLPDGPDAVFLAIPAPQVPDTIRRLAQSGAGGIICYSAGFGEAHAEGQALEHSVKAVLGDVALIGPNCYGLINYVANCALWPFAHGGSCPGYGAAILTQSGMFSSDITMSQRSLPMAYMASVGNQADLGLTELLDLLCERDEVRAIGLHIEGLSEVPAFERAALKAMRAGKPVVALKTGTSSIGEALTRSHTGSLAGSDALYDALFARTGVVRVTNPSQFLETLKFLCVAGAPRGDRVMGFTCSGGGATMLADHAETIGLCFPPPDAEAHETLTALLPPIATVSNPLDYTTPIWGQPELTRPVFASAMAAIPTDAALLVQDYPAPGFDEAEHYYTNDGHAFADAAIAAKLPAAICATIPENMPADIREALVARGIAPMQGIQEALNAIRDAARWSTRRMEILSTAPQSMLSLIPVNAAVLLDEAAGKARLSKAGLPVPNGKVANGTDLVEVATQMGFPVALKMMGPELAHKTDAGAVALGIGSPQALEEAAITMRRDVARISKTALTDRFLIEPMAAKPLAELVVGIRRDAQFGLSMTLGSGGVLVELLEDTATLLLPTSEGEIAQALAGLRVAKLLDGFRGGAQADMGNVTRTLMGLAQYAIDHAEDLVELEINPLFVYADRVLAVDVLMQVTPSAGSKASPERT